MALIDEDGTGKADAESLCSVSAANAYHEGRTGTALATAWAAAGDPAKESALRQATDWLEGEYAALWPGRKKTSAQALSWPRYGAYDINNLPIDESSVPVPVVKACAALAARALSTPLSADLTRSTYVKSQSVGSLSQTFADGAPAETVYTEVHRLLAPLLQPANKMVRA